MKQFGEMNEREIFFLRDSDDNTGLFMSKSLPYYKWPQKIEIRDKIYEFKKLGVLESWMLSDFSSMAEYTIINHDTRPIPAYSKEDEFLAIAKSNFFVKTLENQRSDSLDFHDCHVSGMRNALKESFDLGFFVAIVKTCTLVALILPDDDVELNYIDKHNKYILLKTYQNMRELERDAIKFEFNFGF